MNIWKIIQRKAYDVLSHKYSLLIFIPLILGSILLGSVIEVGEELWAKQSGGGKPVLNSASNFFCGDDTAIDAVYTWVNGSDPLLLHNVGVYKEEIKTSEKWVDCTFRDCEPSHIVAYRSCELLDNTLKNIFPIPFETQKTNAALLHNTTSQCINNSNHQIALLKFKSVSDAVQAAKIKLPTINSTLSHAYWTTDLHAPDSIPAQEWVRLSGFKPKFLSLPLNVLLKKLSLWLKLRVVEVWPDPDHGFAILLLSSVQAVDHIVVSGMLKLGSDVVVVNRLSLVLQVPSVSRVDRYAPSRFEDKEELRYSLRSLEKHAPWIRHIFLVTNGQIPHWLNLDNQRVTIVSHEEIFPNKSHLPTFSSPAIESHLHRIKGLSNKFLYLNDDIMFAQDVWPEDFYTISKGYKVYLSWPVPDCSPSCLWSWVSDGSCDVECNVAECGFDGGDCNQTDSDPFFRSNNPLVREDFSIYDDYIQGNMDEEGDMDKLTQGHKELLVDILKSKKIANRSNFTVRQDIVSKENISFSKLALKIMEKSAPLRNPSSLKISNHTRLSAGLMEENRVKRNIVKKNLGSRLYGESSMVAGQSADFLGSVTDSETAIAEAKKTAGRLRNIERTFEKELYAPREIEARKRYNSYHSLTEKMERSFRLRHLVSANESDFERNNGFSSTTRVRSPKIAEETNLFKNASIYIAGGQRKVDFISDAEKSKERKRLQRQQILLENDLNESVDIAVNNKKDRLKRLKYGKPKPRILDSFAESLLHVNMLYNRAYGFETRRVPAHAPHLIDKNIMLKLQERFKKEWENTSSHKLRSPQDMQFAFSYFYFLMSEETDIPLEDIFNAYDTDRSGTWSDREIRTLLTRLYPAPLNPLHLIKFEDCVLTCVQNTPSTLKPEFPLSTPMFERYQDSPLPTITWPVVRDCPRLKSMILTHLGRKHKYHFEIVREWSREVTFKMLTSNVSHLVGHLDDIRRNPKKFICLNDNLDPKQETENGMVRAILRDFYHSLFPIPSQFELPPDMRNRFLHINELNEWKSGRTRIHTAIILAVITLSLLTIAIIYPEEIRYCGQCFLDCILCLRHRHLRRILKIRIKKIYKHQDNAVLLA